MNKSDKKQRRFGWQAFALGALAGVAAGGALVLLRRRQPSQPPPFALDHLPLAELAGEWYELARTRPLQPGQDWVGTRLSIEADESSLRIACRYRNEQLDAPEQQCRVLLQRGPEASLLMGPRRIWLLELSPAGDYLAAATPDRSHLWVLGRVPELPGPIWSELRQRLQTQGFAPEELVRTPHPGTASHAQ